MLNVGDTIQIDGRKAIVCYTTTYNDENYICAAFDGDEIEYNVYKYVSDNDKFLVSNDVDEETMKSILGTFVNEGLEEYGMPDELNSIFDKMLDENDENHN